MVSTEVSEAAILSLHVQLLKLPVFSGIVEQVGEQGQKLGSALQHPTTHAETQLKKFSIVPLVVL